MKNKARRSEDYIIPQEGFVRQNVVLKVLGISRSSLLRGIESGVYPCPVKLSSRITVWRVDDIRAFISSFDKPDKTSKKRRKKRKKKCAGSP